ncbi:lytic transglycosylase domain-containing protein [soil metagenome]
MIKHSRRLAHFSSAFTKVAASILLCTGLLGASSARADIYMYTDSNGVKNFSNMPIDKRYKAVVFSSNSTSWKSSTVRDTRPINDAVMRTLAQHPNLKRFEPLLLQAAQEFSVDLALLKAVMAAESRFNPAAVSPKGAIGLMQMMPKTAERYGLFGDKLQTARQKLSDPETNIRLGARYLRDLQKLYPGSFELMVASYNAGEGAVQKYNNRIPPYPETQNYVQIVTQFYQMYKQQV